MSTQLAAFGVCIALGQPPAFAWIALAELAVVALALASAARSPATGGDPVSSTSSNFPRTTARAALAPADCGATSATRPRSSPRSAWISTRRDADTPRRLLQALFDATAGYDGDPKLRTAFPAERPQGVDGAHSQIVEGPIAFHALCEHHALPFHGVAHVAYVAGPEILGISKLTRLVRLYARRFTVQERLGERSPTRSSSSCSRAASRSAGGGAPLHAMRGVEEQARSR